MGLAAVAAVVLGDAVGLGVPPGPAGRQPLFRAYPALGPEADLWLKGGLVCPPARDSLEVSRVIA